MISLILFMLGLYGICERQTIMMSIETSIVHRIGCTSRD